MWWRIRDRNCALFLRLFIIYSCYLARVNNEKYIMNRSQLIAIASNAFYQYTHTNIDNRDRSERTLTLTLIFLFFALAVHFSCVLHLCLAPLCSTTSVPHYLFCQFFIHSRHRRCFLFIFSISPIVVDLCFWFFFAVVFQQFCRKLDNWSKLLANCSNAVNDLNTHPLPQHTPQWLNIGFGLTKMSKMYFLKNCFSSEYAQWNYLCAVAIAIAIVVDVKPTTDDQYYQSI